MYFEDLGFGKPELIKPRDDGLEEEPPAEAPKATKAINIIREVKESFVWSEDINKSESNWLFYSVDQGTASACTDNPPPWLVVSLPGEGRPSFPVNYPAGTYPIKTQDGMCAYKNDGKGNPGALWCGDVAHSCKDSGDRSSAVKCPDLMKKQDWLFIEHIPVVTCEW